MGSLYKLLNRAQPNEKPCKPHVYRVLGQLVAESKFFLPREMAREQKHVMKKTRPERRMKDFYRR